MPAAVKNLVIEQKATFSKRLTLRTKLKRPIDLSGCTARMHIRLADGTLIHELTTENGGIVLGGVAGTIDLIIEVADTSAMSFTTAYYDLKLIRGTKEERLLQGKVTLSPGQTT